MNRREFKNIMRAGAHIQIEKATSWRPLRYYLVTGGDEPDIEVSANTVESEINRGHLVYGDKNKRTLVWKGHYQTA